MAVSSVPRRRSPARIFLWIIAILIFLAIAAALAYRLFAPQLMRAAMVPGVEFAASVQAPPPDYAQLSSWQAHPALKSDGARWTPNGYAAAPRPGVAVFFVTPTGFIDRGRWNAPLDDAATNARLEMLLRGQATVFNGVGAIYAPRYRQASFGAFLTDKPAAQQAFDLAYGDVERAFAAFVAGLPPETPIILAGHSQGSMHLLRLIKAQIAGTPLSRRIVAVYVGGWPVSVTADLPALGLSACTAPDQTHCVLSWQSFAEPFEIGDLQAMYNGGTGLTGDPRRGTPMLCTNPLLGRATTDAALPVRNLGALVPKLAAAGQPLPAHAVGATCTPSGIVDIGPPPPGFDAFVLPGNNYHVYDYGLFWANLRADAEARVNAFGVGAIP